MVALDSTRINMRRYVGVGVGVTYSDGCVPWAGDGAVWDDLFM